MKITSREMALGIVTLSVGLFGGTFLLARPRLTEWQRLEKTRALLEDEIRRDSDLVSKRAEWEGRFDALSDAMPQYGEKQKTDVLWLSIIDDVARNHGLEIRRIEAGEERRQGDVYELPIECNEWEGDLDALIHFLFDLQSRGAMLDVRFLHIKPKAGRVLRGRFSLSCAYTRGDSTAAAGGSE